MRIIEQARLAGVHSHFKITDFPAGRIMNMLFVCPHFSAWGEGAYSRGVPCREHGDPDAKYPLILIDHRSLPLALHAAWNGAAAPYFLVIARVADPHQIAGHFKGPQLVICSSQFNSSSSD